eukprot:4929174-Pyramimonas_sp.AAC.1
MSSLASPAEYAAGRACLFRCEGGLLSLAHAALTFALAQMNFPGRIRRAIVAFYSNFSTAVSFGGNRE